MTTDETLDNMAEIFTKVSARVEGIGSHQYSMDLDTHQAFEYRTNQGIVRETLEEIEDAIAYLMFLHIKVQAMLRWAK